MFKQGHCGKSLGRREACLWVFQLASFIHWVAFLPLPSGTWGLQRLIPVAPTKTHSFCCCCLFIFAREWDKAWAGEGRERERQTQNPGSVFWFQALSCQHRAWRGTRTHGPWDHDLNQSQMPDDWATQVSQNPLLKISSVGHYAFMPVGPTLATHPSVCDGGDGVIVFKAQAPVAWSSWPGTSDG